MRRAPRWTGLLAAMGLLLAACAGSDDGSIAAPPDESEIDEAAPDPVAETDDTTEGDDDRQEAPDETDDHGTADHDEHDEPKLRLALADTGSPTVILLDLESGEIVGELTLDAEVMGHGAALTSDGRFLLAPHEDAVTIVDGGAWSDQHGDHAHHYTTDPSVVGGVDGPNPSHLVSHDGRTALFFDGSGDTVVLDESGFADGEVEALATLTSGEPHHGFAVPVSDGYVVTVPTEDMAEMPTVVAATDPAGELLDEYACANTHGETALPDGAAAACQDGVLLITHDGERWDGQLVPYPDVDDQDPYGYGDARAWLFAPSHDPEHLAAPMGSRHVLRVATATAEVDAYSLDQDVALFGVAIDDLGRIVTLTGDGALQVLDPADGASLARTEVMEPFTEGDTSEPYRRLALTADHVYITDPASSTVIEVALDDLAVTRTFELDITPGYLGVVG